MKRILLVIMLAFSTILCKAQSKSENTSVKEDSKGYSQENFQKYFDDLNVKGSITIYDYKNKINDFFGEE